MDQSDRSDQSNRTDPSPPSLRLQIHLPTGRLVPIGPTPPLMKTHCAHVSAGLSAALLLLASPVSFHAFAQSDDFNDGNDTGWARYNPLAPLGAGASYSFPAGAYRITAPASPDPNVYGPARAGSLFPAATFKRARVEVDLFGWLPTLTQSVGVFARAADLGLGTTTGYTYNYNILSGFHQINLVLSENPARIVNESIFRLNSEHRYRMIFTATENRFLGRLYSSTNSQVPIHSLFGTDDTLSSGQSGVFVFAVDPLARLDARFDNYVASTAGRVRATMLDAAPAVGEVPTGPATTVVVRLASVETSVRPESIRLNVDGKDVSFESSEFESILTLTHTPATALDPGLPHQASIRFSDEDGEQSFSWSFGTPATVTPKLLGSASLGGPFQPETGAVLDGVARRFTAPVLGEQRFYRVEDATARTLKSVEITGPSVRINFE